MYNIIYWFEDFVKVHIMFISISSWSPFAWGRWMVAR